MGFHHANFGLPRHFRSRVEARDRQTDRQTDMGHNSIMHLPYRGRAYKYRFSDESQVLPSATLADVAS